MQQLLQNQPLATCFDSQDPIDVEYQLKKLIDFGVQLPALDLRLAPNFKHFELLSRFKPLSLKLQINEKPQLEKAAAPTAQNAILKAKTLQKMALKEDSVFPFHDFYDLNYQKQILDKKIENEEQMVEISRRFFIQQKDLLQMTDLVAGLQELRVINSGLTDELLQTLCLLLKQTKVKHLDISNNLVSDLAPVLKLCSTQQSNFLEVLNVQRNNLTHPACLQLMKAMKQEQFFLKELLLNGNNLGDGWLLLANGLLETSTRFANKPLQRLDLSECHLKIKLGEEAVIVKVVFEAELQWLGMNGAQFEDPKAIKEVLDQCGDAVSLVGAK